ncbi:MAG: cytochrome c [Alphaproteobacteria bacterium]|nr:cytochrome c [Alphaproteobacteria bacterium]MBU0798440.1 cytochrome c [Alphaproteobacteria bacterium]MBU1812564.1 cytochrome c [Alphaproteobacteria bacterium]
MRIRAYWLAVPALLAGAIATFFLLQVQEGTAAGSIDPANRQLVSLGQDVYAAQCASCHGANLEGQADWKIRLDNGRLPAPPHDASGHTWHHPDRQLFEITKYGVERHAPPGYESDMPAFEHILSDREIIAALAYIKSTWPAEIRARQQSITRKAEK